MKRLSMHHSISILVLSFGIWFGASAQKGPVISFEATDYDFGEVEMGTVVEKVYRFQNTGTSPLIVSKAKPGCGCTKVEFQADTLAPGEWGSVKMIFDTHQRLGRERNSVAVWTNTEPPIRKVTFHGVIVPAKKEEASPPSDH